MTGGVKMAAKIVNGKLIIEIPLNPEPVLSSTGKTMLVASGNVKIAHDKKVVTVQVNSYFKA